MSKLIDFSVEGLDIHGVFVRDARSTPLLDTVY